MQTAERPGQAAGPWATDADAPAANTDGCSPREPGCVGASAPSPARVLVVDYDAAEIREWEADSPRGLGHPEAGKIRWIDVQGLGDVGGIQALCETLGLHPIITEDILDLEQRTKLELFADHFFVVVDTFYYPGPQAELQSEQISFLVFEDLVVT
ncbi:MAG: hypothetical protein H5T86_15090, partial [Armatimonadetes bacterium]|nr:hypothetical protein [Armatimonadota bacterium]